jgi:hypothetical protein
MNYEDLKRRTTIISQAARDAIGDNEQVGFLLITAANGENGHLIFTASNLERDTALYLASMAEDVMAQDSADTIGAVMGSA